MTQEEKAKAYDEVVNKLRHFMAQGVEPLITRADVQDFFPELKESEDERIRKALLEYFGEECDTATINGIYCYKIYDWLKKQGNKPTIMWHDVSEKPDEMREILVEWESDDATWHTVGFYDAGTDKFREYKIPINTVVRWMYVDELLEKQRMVEQQ